MQTIQKSTKDIIDKYQNNGTKPIDLVLFGDIGLQGTYYDYAVLYQMIQAKIKELRNEIKNTD